MDNQEFHFPFKDKYARVGLYKNTNPRQIIMHKTIALFALLTLPLAGCLEDPATRGLAGAAGGALVADAFNGNVLTGAVIGGLAGAATCGVNVGLPPCY